MLHTFILNPLFLDYRFALLHNQPHRATREMVAVPRGVHRSLVNRYGPRTPAVVAGKPADANGFKATPGPGESAGRVSVGRGRGRGQGMALVGSSRPLLELTSCTACAALEEEMALAKSTEQKEVGVCVCVRVCTVVVEWAWYVLFLLASRLAFCVAALMVVLVKKCRNFWRLTS